jgi:hypothetical protein
MYKYINYTNPELSEHKILIIIIITIIIMKLDIFP